MHHEQGFGDSIMLSRFLPALMLRGAHVTVVVPEELRSLFALNFPFIRVISFEHESLDGELHFDYHTPMLSMMRHLGVLQLSDISDKPYLRTTGALSWKLPPGFKIGLCWASGNHGPALAERRRMVPVTSFLPLLKVPGISSVSLQKGKETKDLVDNGLEGLVFDASPRIEDFADTAAVIDKLDLVISVDSAVAHLAGAMGKPVLMLAPYTRCWRWWRTNEGSGQPWYGMMKILPQEKNGSWAAAADSAVRLALKYSKVAEKVFD